MFAGSSGFTKRRNSGSGEIQTGKYASSKRARTNAQIDEYEESPFHESSEKDRYLITYADLITLLLGLFILLYTASNLDIQKYEKMLSAFGNVFGTETAKIKIDAIPEKVISTPLDKLKNDITQLIAETDTKSIRMEENERGITIHILEDIVFPSGSAELKPTSKFVLKKVADIIKKLPNDIRVEGHTDNIPISSAAFPSNWHLSVARALNTAYYLIKDEGVNPDKVSIVGYAEYKPIELNDTPYGRASNRRVDIVIIK
ncbi:OmpA family protein [Ignavibacterium sp.]|uniref:OmpA/MotB family protein n=1 Tax=Ignavibacterium sp. TaxID=2651167 RepID=UPI00307F18A3